MKLRELRKEKGMTMKELGAAFGMSESVISIYETGKRMPDVKTLQDFASYFGVSLNYLLGETEEIENNSVQIPVLGIVPAGVPIEAIQEFVDEYQDIPAAMARTGEYFGLKIKGDSMYPYYMEGDTVIVKKQSDVESGDKAIVYVNGYDATCKIVQKTTSGIRLVPYNVAHPPKEYTFEEIEKLPVSIVGKVVEVRREER
ncbi:MAG: LexA family protein [Christensenellaceae bacterium]|jgi:repressor LexA